MYVYRSLDEVPDSEGMNVTLTLGVFDGVHLGHRKILDRVGTFFETGVQVTGLVTFDKHPIELLAPENAPMLLTTMHEKIAALSEFRLTYTLVLPFDRDLAGMSAERFVEDVLVERLMVNKVIVGYDTRFGSKGKGDMKLLTEMGQRWNFKTETVEVVKQGTGPISSTAIRTLLEKGDVQSAAQMLGRPYTIEGKVVKGIGLGRRIGIPTINVSSEPRKLLPHNGVYAAYCSTPAGRKKAVVNIGVKPTIPREKATRVVEAHLMDFDGDLYGHNVVLELWRIMRAEKKFDNVKDLIVQIRKDIELAKNMLFN